MLFSPPHAVGRPAVWRGESGAFNRSATSPCIAWSFMTKLPPPDNLFLTGRFLMFLGLLRRGVESIQGMMDGFGVLVVPEGVGDVDPADRVPMIDPEPFRRPREDTELMGRQFPRIFAVEDDVNKVVRRFLAIASALSVDLLDGLGDL